MSKSVQDAEPQGKRAATPIAFGPPNVLSLTRAAGPRAEVARHDGCRD
jgi:hypothetical protein